MSGLMVGKMYTIYRCNHQLASNETVCTGWNDISTQTNQDNTGEMTHVNNCLHTTHAYRLKTYNGNTL